eukprot:snap_masked-scaffold574_size133225-processed-gene-0.14 protein:Tk07454 transcript:snap_masked-scaffold574_size133225-processed-gene-0.14-mRNA-1 annotation:"protein cbr-nhr-119"
MEYAHRDIHDEDTVRDVSDVIDLVENLATSKVCPVCSFVSEDDLRFNYGCRSCFSCRAFFRRAVPRMAQLSCQHGGKCTIDSSNRSRCRKCRFSSCLRHGMNPSQVMDEDSKRKRFWKAHQKRSQDGSKQPSSQQSPDKRKRQLSSTTNSSSNGSNEVLESESLKLEAELVVKEEMSWEASVACAGPSVESALFSPNSAFAVSGQADVSSSDKSNTSSLSPPPTHPSTYSNTSATSTCNTIVKNGNEMPSHNDTKSRSRLMSMLLSWQRTVDQNVKLDPDFMQALQSTHLMQVDISKVILKAHLQQLDRVIWQWIHSLEEFQELQVEDRLVLADENRSMVSSYVLAKYLSPATSGQDQVNWLFLRSGPIQKWLANQPMLHCLEGDNLILGTENVALRDNIQAIQEFKVSQDWLCVIAFASAFFTQPNASILLRDQTTIFNSFFDSMELVDCLQWEVGNFWNFLEKIKQLSKQLNSLNWAQELIRVPTNMYSVDEDQCINKVLGDIAYRYRSISFGSEIVQEVLMMGLDVPPSPKYLRVTPQVWKSRISAILEGFPEYSGLNLGEKVFMGDKSFFTALGVLTYWNERLKGPEEQIQFLFGHDDLNCYLENYQVNFPIAASKVISMSNICRLKKVASDSLLEPLEKGKAMFNDFITSFELALLLLLVALLCPARSELQPTKQMKAIDSLCSRFETILIRKSSRTGEFVRSRMNGIESLQQGQDVIKSDTYGHVNASSLWGMFNVNLIRMMEETEMSQAHRNTHRDPRDRMTCPVPSEFEVVSPSEVTLSFSGQALSGSNFFCPHVLASHDLAGSLQHVVSPGVWGDYPSGWVAGYTLNVKALNGLMAEQIRVMCIPQRKLASGMNMNPGKVSSYLRETRAWLNLGHNAQKFFYYALVWLSLSVKDRVAVFHPILPVEEDAEMASTATIPEVAKLLAVLQTEMKLLGLSVDMLAESILGETETTAASLIQSPLPWTMMPRWQKLAYSRIWFWLKQPAERRRMWASSPQPRNVPARREYYPDVCSFFEEIRMYLRSAQVSLSELLKALKCENAYLEELLRQTGEWPDLDVETQMAYCLLLKWFDCRRYEMNPFKEPLVEPGPRHEISIKSTPTKIHPGLVRRLNALKPVNVSLLKCNQPTKTPSVTATKDPVDTNAVANAMLGEMKEGKITLKSFAQSLNINRSYFASLMRLPIPWKSTTTLQKSIYQAIKQWLESNPEERAHFKKNLIAHRQSQTSKHIANAKENVSDELEKQRTQQQRVHFTRTQRELLIEKFGLNPRPTASEKIAIAKELRLPLRTVGVFFCNRRRRHAELSQKRMSQLGANCDGK